MDSVELHQNGDCVEDMSADQLLSLDSSDACDVFGEPEVVPRVGDQYQVEIPPLIGEDDCLKYKKNPINAENVAGVPYDFLIGLPIPIVWITKEVENMKRETLEFLGDPNYASNKNGPSAFESVRDTQLFSENKDSKLKVEPFNGTLDDGVRITESANLDLEDKMHQYRGPRHWLVPGSCGDSWSDTEQANFLLGLYIFEKNFVQVKRFIESKRMGDILSFYYGKFYRSDEYRRWSECLKMRSKRCAYGQRIFSGLRQQELLSRLLFHVSEECQNALLEVSRTFGEGKMSLEEYVSSLKAMVGINILVEAVGIGKGKQDLTGIAMEPLKSNQVIHMRPEIPTGKACSSLTPGEIIKFLTGDYRLSKARSNDLFWEAVWPRLLARGWHSEQPKNQSYAAGSKHSLVFLMPGVKKFSRRRLVKGNHYFDCVTDVLSKVASEPGLLELDIEEDEGNRSKEEYGWTNETKLEQDDFPERQRHSYLQPRTPSRATDAMKFTVVDTSLTAGKTFKVRELRTLPLEISKNLTSRSRSEDSDEDAAEVSSDESDCDYNMLLDKEKTNKTKPRRTMRDRVMSSDRKDLEMGASYEGISIDGPDYASVPVKSSNNYKIAPGQGIPLNGPYSADVPVKSDESDCDYTMLLDNEKTNKTMPKRTIRDKVMSSDWKDLEVSAPGQGIPLNGPYSADVPVKSSKNLKNSHREMFSDGKDLEVSASDKGIPINGSDSANGQVKISKNHDNLCKDKQTRKAEKCHLSQRLKQDNLDCLTPFAKRRRRLTSCNRAEMSHGMMGFSVVPRRDEEMRSCCSETPDLTENILTQVGSSQDKLSSTGSSVGSPSESIDAAPSDNCQGAENPCEKPQFRTLIDLNLPQFPPDFETDVFKTKGHDDHVSEEPDDARSLKTSVGVTISEQQPNMNSRRHGTRTRPPTARALEALANGFLTTNRKWKNKEANSTPRSSRRSRGGVGVSKFSTDNASLVTEGGNAVCNGVNSSTLVEFQVMSEGNGTQVGEMSSS